MDTPKMWICTLYSLLCLFGCCLFLMQFSSTTEYVEIYRVPDMRFYFFTLSFSLSLCVSVSLILFLSLFLSHIFSINFFLFIITCVLPLCLFDWLLACMPVSLPQLSQFHQISDLVWNGLSVICVFVWVGYCTDDR